MHTVWDNLPLTTWHISQEQHSGLKLTPGPIGCARAVQYNRQKKELSTLRYETYKCKCKMGPKKRGWKIRLLSIAVSAMTSSLFHRTFALAPFHSLSLYHSLSPVSSTQSHCVSQAHAPSSSVTLTTSFLQSSLLSNAHSVRNSIIPRRWISVP